MGVEIIEKPKSVSILLTLLDNPEGVGVRSLIDKVGGSATTTISRLKELEDAGLVSHKFIRTNKTWSKCITLTEKGRKVAELLAQIRGILGGN